MRRFEFSLFPALVAGAAALGLLGLRSWAQGPAAAVPVPPAIPSQPIGPVSEASNYRASMVLRASINKLSADFREGEDLALTVACDADAFVYVFYRQADGQTFLVFPNSEQPENRIPARQAVSIPSSTALFRWTVGAPFGDERITVLATREPLENLTDPQLREAVFNAVGAKQLKGVELELGEEPAPAWTVQHVDLHTYARSQSLPERSVRRAGVFFGIADYLFNAEAELASERGQGLNLPTGNLDARELAERLKESGELQDYRVYTNGQATKKQIQESITSWLPSVTRPGDTAFIYFSGHGGQLPDLDGDEGADEKNDEQLIPADYLGYGMYLKLEETAGNRELSPAKTAIFLAAKQLLAQFGSEYERALALELTTAITDDEFGQWLAQALPGRKVIVILDSCHSGGFGGSEKSLPRRGAPGGAFNFLDREAGRVKDLRAGSWAILATCPASKTIIVPQAQDFPLRISLMTYYLVDLLRTARGSVTLEDAFRYCQGKMQQYFTERGKEITLPQYATTIQEPLFLKP